MIESDSSSDSSSSSSDSDTDPGEEDPVTKDKPRYKIPKTGKIWSPDQIANLKQHFPYLEHLDISILSRLSFKEMVARDQMETRGTNFCRKN